MGRPGRRRFLGRRAAARVSCCRVGRRSSGCFVQGDLRPPLLFGTSGRTTSLSSEEEEDESAMLSLRLL